MVLIGQPPANQDISLKRNNYIIISFCCFVLKQINKLFKSVLDELFKFALNKDAPNLTLNKDAKKESKEDLKLKREEQQK